MAAPAQPRVVFVYEPDPALAMPLRTALLQAGYAAHSFESLELALQSASEIKPDILVTDTSAPHFRGLYLALQISAQHRGTKILYTARPEDLAIQGLEGRDSVKKPYCVAEIVEAVGRMLQESEG